MIVAPSTSSRRERPPRFIKSAVGRMNLRCSKGSLGAIDREDRWLILCADRRAEVLRSFPRRYLLEGSDAPRVQLSARDSPQLVQRGLHASCLLVGPVRGHCIKCVGDGDDPGLDRDFFAPEAV